MDSVDTFNYIAQKDNIISEMDYPFELILAIQMHFNKKVPLESIKACLKKNNNDLFLCLRDLNATITDPFPKLSKSASTSTSSSIVFNKQNDLEQSGSVVIDKKIIVARADTASLLRCDENNVDKKEKQRIEAIRKRQQSQLIRLEERKRKKVNQLLEDRRVWEREIEQYRHEDEEMIEKQRQLDPEETILEYLQSIQQWIGLERFEIVYDSNTHGKTSNNINSKICGLHNVMILIITRDGYAFGTFNSKKIPHPKNNYVYIKYDKKYFVFSLRNPSSTNPTQFKVRHKKKSLCIWPNNELQYCITTKRCFRVKQHEEEDTVHSYFLDKFSTHYVDPNKHGYYIFANSTAFDVHKIVGVRWF
ncbi:TLDc domain-containing protein [Entamoeba marina]